MTYRQPKINKFVDYKKQGEIRFALRLKKLHDMHMAEMRNILKTYPPCSIKEDDSTYGDRIMHNETY